MAFLLRIWGIWNADSTDEYNEIFEALRVCSGNLNFERWFKRFYLYILSLEYGIYYILGWISGVFEGPIDFAAKVVRDMDPLFIIARTNSVIFGTTAIFITYLIGKSLYSKSAGIIASLFLCLNVVNIELSHYARVDATLCLVILLSFYYIIKIYNDGPQLESKYYILAGLFAGIAFQTKIPAVILIIPFCVAHISKYLEASVLARIFSKKILWFGLTFILGLIIGNPAILFAPVKFVSSLFHFGVNVYTTPLAESKSDHIGFVAYLIYFYKEFGLMLFLFFGYSICNAIISKRKDDLLLLSFIVPFYLLMGATYYKVSFSYMIPIMPFIYVLIARHLIDLSKKISLPRKASKGVLVIMIVILAAHQAVESMNFELSLSGKNTRVLAKEWIELNIPYGSKILMDSGKTINSAAPKIAEDSTSIKRRITSAEKMISGETHLMDTTKMVDRSSLIYFDLLLKTVPKESYDITSTMFGLDLETLDYYISNNFEYFIISDSMKRSRTSEFFSNRHPKITKFYKSLDTDRRIKLIKTINPTPRNRGQSFFIYKVAGE
jgi:hypothetical protein